MKKLLKKEYIDGVYQGQYLQERYKHGIGVFLWQNGCAYIGEWKTNHVDGEGVLFAPPRTFVHGIFKNNKLNGPVYIRTSEWVFEGTFVMGQPDGEMLAKRINTSHEFVITCRKGVVDKITKELHNRPAKIQLSSLQDLCRRNPTHDLHQMGFVVKQDGSKYLGVIMDNVPCGLGITQLTDGLFDCGNYEDGVVQGCGRVQYQDGQVYQGGFWKGQYQGHGILIYRVLQQDQNHIEWLKGQWASGYLVETEEKGVIDENNLPDKSKVTVKYQFLNEDHCLKSSTCVKLPLSFQIIRDLELLMVPANARHSISNRQSVSEQQNEQSIQPKSRDSGYSDHQKMTLQYLNNMRSTDRQGKFIKKDNIRSIIDKYLNISESKVTLHFSDSKVILQNEQKRESRQDQSSPSNQGASQIQNYYQSLLNKNIHSNDKNSRQSNDKNSRQSNDKNSLQNTLSRNGTNRTTSSNQANNRSIKSSHRNNDNKNIPQTLQYKTYKPQAQQLKTASHKQFRNSPNQVMQNNKSPYQRSMKPNKSPRLMQQSQTQETIFERRLRQEFEEKQISMEEPYEIPQTQIQICIQKINCESTSVLGDYPSLDSHQSSHIALRPVENLNCPNRKALLNQKAAAIEEFLNINDEALLQQTTDEYGFEIKKNKGNDQSEKYSWVKKVIDLSAFQKQNEMDQQKINKSIDQQKQQQDQNKIREQQDKIEELNKKINEEQEYQHKIQKQFSINQLYEMNSNQKQEQQYEQNQSQKQKQKSFDMMVSSQNKEQIVGQIIKVKNIMNQSQQNEESVQNRNRKVKDNQEVINNLSQLNNKQQESNQKQKPNQEQSMEMLVSSQKLEQLANYQNKIKTIINHTEQSQNVESVQNKKVMENQDSSQKIIQVQHPWNKNTINNLSLTKEQNFNHNNNHNHNHNQKIIDLKNNSQRKDQPENLAQRHSIEQNQQQSTQIENYIDLSNFSRDNNQATGPQIKIISEQKQNSSPLNQKAYSLYSQTSKKTKMQNKGVQASETRVVLGDQKANKNFVYGNLVNDNAREDETPVFKEQTQRSSIYRRGISFSKDELPLQYQQSNCSQQLIQMERFKSFGSQSQTQRVIQPIYFQSHYGSVMENRDIVRLASFSLNPLTSLSRITGQTVSPIRYNWNPIQRKIVIKPKIRGEPIIKQGPYVQFVSAPVNKFIFYKPYQ